jgi:hypothetical protein
MHDEHLESISIGLSEYVSNYYLDAKDDFIEKTLALKYLNVNNK